MTKIIGGIPMELPIILGAGVCKYVPQLTPYQRHDVSLGATILGAITPEMRLGNQEQPLFWPDDWRTFQEAGFGCNSFGMNNAGVDLSFAALRSVNLVHPLIANLAAFTVEDYLKLLLKVESCQWIAGSEVNLGCGNTGKPPHAYDLDFITQLLVSVSELRRLGRIIKPIWLKLSPYLTLPERDQLATLHPEIDFTAVPTVVPGFFEKVVEHIERSRVIAAIVFSNTLANCQHLGPDGRPVTGPFGGRAGLSGPILHDISLRLITQAYSIMPEPFSLDLIHSGGNLTGKDVARALYIADAVQCTSGPFWYGDGPRFFADLINSGELEHSLVRNGWITTSDF